MSDYQTGTVILPGWEIVRPIGGGGFGKVYEVKKTDSSESECHSAVKIIPIPRDPGEFEAYLDDGYDEASVRSIFRFQVDSVVAELAAMSQFRGMTNVVSYEDRVVSEHPDGRGWDIVVRMEYLTSLTELLKTNDLSEREVIQLGVDVCTALELCKQQNVIHRDIKPQNVFINKFGNYKLGDFGVSKAMGRSAHATRIGTANYMSPEVYLNKPFDDRTDQYSLGLMMYWMLNERRLPFLPLPPAVETAGQREKALERRLNGEPIPRPVHGCDALVKVVLKACAFDPSDRYPDPTRMKYALFAAMAEASDGPLASVSANAAPTAKSAGTASASAESGSAKEEIAFIPCNTETKKTEPEPEPEPEPVPEPEPEPEYKPEPEPEYEPEPEPEYKPFREEASDEDDGTIGLVSLRRSKSAEKPGESAPKRETERLPDPKPENKTESAPIPTDNTKPIQPTLPPQPPLPVQRKKKKSGVLVGIIAALLLVALLAGGGFFLWQKYGGIDGILSLFEEKSEGLEYRSVDKNEWSVCGVGVCDDEEITIPVRSPFGGKVTEIGPDAFSGCTDLTEITIPAEVTSIGQNAFNGCTALTEIVFKGKIDLWNAVEKENGWNEGVGSLTVHCKDGDIDVP